MLSAANIGELEAVNAELEGLLEIRRRIQALLEKAKPQEREQPDLAAQVAEQQRLRTQHLRLQTQQHQFGGAS
jgi:hypothetical protein